MTQTASLAGTANYTNQYAYDHVDRLTRITQSGTGVSQKRADLEYNGASQFTAIRRYANTGGTQQVVSATYGYEPNGRLDSLQYAAGGSTLRSINYDYDLGGRISYRSNQFGTTNYGYDNEGNRTRKTHSISGDYTEYQWDHRNRLVKVLDYTVGSGQPVLTKSVSYSYDYQNRMVRRTIDTDGAGPATATDRFFANDGTQTVMEFNGSATSNFTNRYLWGPVVDQLLADERVGGDTYWPLTDNLGTIHDWAKYDASTNTAPFNRQALRFSSDVYDICFSTALVRFLGKLLFSSQSGAQWNLSIASEGSLGYNSGSSV